MKIVLSPKHKNVLVSPGVLTGVLVNCGLECHNGQATGVALGQTQFSAHSELPWPRWVA